MQILYDLVIKCLEITWPWYYMTLILYDLDLPLHIKNTLYDINPHCIFEIQYKWFTIAHVPLVGEHKHFVIFIWPWPYMTLMFRSIIITSLFCYRQSCYVNQPIKSYIARPSITGISFWDNHHLEIILAAIFEISFDLLWPWHFIQLLQNLILLHKFILYASCR